MQPASDFGVGKAQPAVSVVGYQANSYVVFSDGMIQAVDVSDGAFGDFWQIDPFTPDSAPLKVGETLVFHTSDDALVAMSLDLREILWRLDGIPDFDQAHVGGALIGLIADETLWLVSHQGALVGQAMLRNGAFLTR